MLNSPSLAGRVCARLDAGKRMIYRFRHGIIGPLALLWLTVTVASVVMGAVAWSRFSRSIDASAEAEQLRESIDQLFSVLQDAEASQRGYLLTGNAAYREAFTNAERSFPAAFERLAASARHDPAGQSDLIELRRLVDLELADLRQAVALRAEKGPAGSELAASPEQTRTTMDRIREIIKRRHDNRLDLLSASGEATRREMKWVHQMTWIAGLLGVGAGVFALYFYRVDYYQERGRRELLEEKLHAEQSVREKSAFLANMSHEIRSPMNAILGFSELLEPDGLTPKQAQYVRAIRDSGAALLHLINDILDLSKLEAGKLELHPDPTDMRDSCQFLRTVFGQQAVTKSLQLQFELSPNLPRALLLDRLRLRQVLVNLLSNAIKFTERGRVKTRVSWESQDDGRSGTLLIDVEDTGIGIPAEELEEVFKPFVQAEARQTAEKEGTGIGLTIVKRLTELMGGSLTVESKVGQGTVFHLRFANVPVSGRLPVGDHAEPGGAVDFNDFAPATLLVVDDNPTNRAYMAGIFEKTHHHVHFANNGQEALASSGEGQARCGIARYPNAGDGRANGPGGDPQASQSGVAAGHRGHRFEQGRRRDGAAKAVQRLHSQALLAANALCGAGSVSPKGVAREWTGRSESRANPQEYSHPSRPTRPLSGRNSLSNCAAGRQPNGRRCVTAWRLMRRGPLLTTFSPSARRPIALR